jgi:hypothetical protein
MKLIEETVAFAGACIILGVWLFMQGEVYAKWRFVGECSDTYPESMCVQFWEVGSGELEVAEIEPQRFGPEIPLCDKPLFERVEDGC